LQYVVVLFWFKPFKSKYILLNYVTLFMIS